MKERLGYAEQILAKTSIDSMALYGKEPEIGARCDDVVSGRCRGDVDHGNVIGTSGIHVSDTIADP